MDLEVRISLGNKDAHFKKLEHLETLQMKNDFLVRPQMVSWAIHSSFWSLVWVIHRSTFPIIFHYRGQSTDKRL